MRRHVTRTVATALLGAAGLAGALLPLTASPVSAAEMAGKADRVEVVAAFYPVAWAAERVGGRRVTVTNLTPAGTEPHDLELSPDQRDDIEDADVVLVLGRGFQPAVEDAADARDRGTVALLDRLPIPERSGSVADGLDPHVWLDPTLMASIVDETAAALTRADPRGARTYAANAETTKRELVALDARYAAGLAQCDRRLVVTAHEAFGYLAAAHGLTQEGVAGLAPDAEPDPRRLADLADLAKRRGVTTVFTEELVSPKIARTVAREAGGIRTDTLNPLEGLSAREQRRGDDYVSVMDTNLARLRTALGCT
jgi:zinc transport system substrate-binding protein